MTDSEQAKMAATIAAHEAFLVLLLAPMFRSLSPAQSEAMAAAMTAGPNFQTPPGFAIDDLGLADELAGLALDYRDAVNRIVASALAKSQVAAP